MKPQPSKVSLIDEIACVEREIKFRASVYPRLIGRERMSQAAADHELAAMQAVLARLRAIAHPGRI